MNIVALVLVALVALIHIYILILEMFFWTTPRGQAAFGLTAEFAESTKVLAANQGLYNGFLAAGLIWGMFAGLGVQVFFLLCVAVAGVYGAVTSSRKIIVVQTIPAAVALIAALVAAR